MKKRTVHKKKRISKKRRANKSRKQRGGENNRYNHLMDENERNNPLSYWVDAKKIPGLFSNLKISAKKILNKTPTEKPDIGLDKNILKVASGLIQTVYPWNVRVPLPDGASLSEKGNLVSFTFRESDNEKGLPSNFIQVFADIYEKHKYKSKNVSVTLSLTTIEEVKTMALGVYPIYLDWKAKFYKANPELQEPQIVRDYETPENGVKIVEKLGSLVAAKEGNNRCGGKLCDVNNPKIKIDKLLFPKPTYLELFTNGIEEPPAVPVPPPSTPTTIGNY